MQHEQGRVPFGLHHAAHIKGPHSSLEIARHHLENIRLGRVRKLVVLIERRAKAVQLNYKGGKQLAHRNWSIRLNQKFES